MAVDRTDEAKRGSGGGDDKMEEELQRKVLLLRAFLQSQSCSAFVKEVDDPTTMRRFLRARDMNVEKARAMLWKYVEWRRTIGSGGSVSESEVPNQIKQEKMFTQGVDRRGCPITVVLGANHFQIKHGLDEFKRFVVFGLDKLCSRMVEGQEKFVIIVDLQGWGYPNSDIHGYLGALSILQDYYPERLGKVYVIHIPRIFMAVWKIVYPFIDNNTKKKIVFVEDKRLKSTLLEDIEEDQLPEIYGGKLPLVPIHQA